MAYKWEFEAKTGNLNAAAKAMERLDRVSQAFTKTAQTIETGFARINAAFEAATAKATVAAKAFDLLNKSRADLGMKGGAAVAQASSRRAPFPKKTHDVCLRQEILSFLKNRTRRNLNVLYVKKM